MQEKESYAAPRREGREETEHWKAEDPYTSCS